ncbi:retroviral ribonuclease H, LTR Retrotransposon, partial [Trachipleistophora hominis]
SQGVKSSPNKPEFDNNRLNWWYRTIQQYDFTIEYGKPINLVKADALSRKHEKVKEPTEVNKKTVKRHETINEKHLFAVDGKKYCRFDSGIVRGVPESENTEKLIIEAHLKTNHRGLVPIYYELKERYYWLGMKRHITEIIKGVRRVSGMRGTHRR